MKHRRRKEHDDATQASARRTSRSYRPPGREDRGRGEGSHTRAFTGREDRCGSRGRHTRARPQADLSDALPCISGGVPLPLVVVVPGYGLFFDYENHDVILVTVEQSGCRFATNGRRVATVDDAVMARITALLGAR